VFCLSQDGFGISDHCVESFSNDTVRTGRHAFGDSRFQLPSRSKKFGKQQDIKNSTSYPSARDEEVPTVVVGQFWKFFCSTFSMMCQPNRSSATGATDCLYELHRALNLQGCPHPHFLLRWHNGQLIRMPFYIPKSESDASCPAMGG
jgi:hypothetical protein